MVLVVGYGPSFSLVHQDFGEELGVSPVSIE